MKVTVLGCGSFFSRQLGNTAFLVEHNDIKLVIDCGFTVPKAIEQYIPLNQVTHYYISHLHGDHAGGLEEVCFRNYYLYKHKPILIIGEDLWPNLWANYLSGSLRYGTTPEGDQDMILSPDSYFSLYKQQPGKWIELSGSNLYFVLYKTKHVMSMPNYSLLILDNQTKKQILFTCDAVFGNKLPYKAVDLIFHDCSFTPRYPNTVHTHFEELLTLPLEVQKKIVAVHYEDSVIPKEPLFSADIAPVRLATPGMTFSL